MRIEIYLLDFGIWSMRQNTPLTGCTEYANIVEQSTGENFRVCGGRQRLQHVYTSKTSTLEISVSLLLPSNRDIVHHFLLEYKGEL